jgi:hypothetical protein
VCRVSISTLDSHGEPAGGAILIMDAEIAGA